MKDNCLKTVMAVINNCLLFNGFDSTIPKEMVSFLFGKYGPIKDIKMVTDKDGYFLGSGYVEFNSESIPEKVCKEVSTMNLFGSNVKVSLFASKKVTTKRLIKNLHANIRDKMTLSELTQKLNELIAVVIAKGDAKYGVVCYGNAVKIPPKKHSKIDTFSVYGNALFFSTSEENKRVDCNTFITNTQGYFNFDFISKIPFKCNFMRKTAGEIDCESQLYKLLERCAGVSLKIRKYENSDTRGYKFFCTCSPLGECNSEAAIDQMFRSEFIKSVHCKSTNTEEIKVDENDTNDVESSTTENEFEHIEQIVNCFICFNEYFGTECIDLFCGHIICEECFVHFIRYVITDKKINPIHCPINACQQEVSYEIVIQNIPNDLMVKYETCLYENFIESADDILHCPRARCNGLVFLTNEPTLGVCQTCNYTFCTNCEEEYHGSTPCDQFENEAHKQQVLNNYMNGGEDVKRSLEKRYKKKKLEDLVEELLSNQCIKTTCKPCPSCNASIEKTGGCNKIICTKCNSFFCWMCNAILSTSAPYSHFYGGKCYV